MSTRWKLLFLECLNLLLMIILGLLTFGLYYRGFIWLGLLTFSGMAFIPLSLGFLLYIRIESERNDDEQ